VSRRWRGSSTPSRAVAVLGWRGHHLISTQARRRRGRGQDPAHGRHGRRPGRRGQGRGQCEMVCG
jgi:hypothetical protein